ncbi:MAG: 2-dehydropantoate 2-reductase [Candidatus Methylomirabilis sp.]|nr:2-dehydropantoate 2-reductase [Candidatus Methylomirabilis sp.]
MILGAYNAETATQDSVGGDNVMNVAVVGVGAVGGYFGGLLAKGGANVTFIARGKRLEALRATGLTVKKLEGGLRRPRQCDR